MDKFAVALASLEKVWGSNKKWVLLGHNQRKRFAMLEDILLCFSCQLKAPAAKDIRLLFHTPSKTPAAKTFPPFLICIVKRSCTINVCAIAPLSEKSVILVFLQVNLSHL